MTQNIDYHDDEIMDHDGELCAFQTHKGGAKSYFKRDEARKRPFDPNRNNPQPGNRTSQQVFKPSPPKRGHCTFCKGRAVRKGLQLTPELLSKMCHRFDSCPLLSHNREIMEDLKALDKQPRLQL